MTKSAFTQAYRTELLNTYGHDWAGVPEKLERFMRSVHTTLFTQANTWNIDSPCVVRAWRAIGCKGKPTYKGLRALAD